MKNITEYESFVQVCHISLRCGATNSYFRRPFRDCTLWNRWQGEAWQQGFWHSHLTIHPLGFYCFKFGSNWAATWVRLRPRVQTLSWPHISAVIKLATRQNRLGLYSEHTVFRNVTCSHSLVTGRGKYDTCSLQSAPESESSYWERRSAFDNVYHADTNNNTFIYSHMKSCTQMQTSTFF